MNDADNGTAKATAEADKLTAEAAKLRAEAEAARSKAEAEVTKLVAEAAKIDTEARKLEADAEIARWKALVPDFGAIESGKITVPEGRIGRSAILGQMALEDAARKLEPKIGLGSRDVVLVTSEVDLASTGAAYLEVKTASDSVIARAREVTGKANKGADPGDPKTDLAFAPGLLGVGAAAVAALPGILSMFRTDHSQSVVDLAADDEAAATLVCEMLLKEKAQATVVEDRFRLVEESGIWTVLKTLGDARTDLVEARLRRFPPDAERPKPGTPEALLLAEIEAATAAVVGLEASLRSVPAGRSRAPIVEAALYERLYGTDAKFTHVLLVRAHGGQVQQDIADRNWLFGKDTVNLIAEASISFRLLSVADNKLVGAGLASGRAQAHGRPGERLRIEAG
ncbi:MAG TPA: hypothetical protein PKA33_01160 [Amaricoccus sp.]|uniref:hypothetical protein n=1 Tax=Amaricoccus sp. TaxID=1872485 RepID=UPI002B5D05EC|nr:hypothetical protein [Amaricoccus sp.]HMQ92115.1 hypothetical protein [Amaricoccus sp.]HMR50868.1 hypothetical protein [Amaricoccus sp.]HMR60213.1 hypothetical protein [Amaricoccus sp.]HMT97953.1 hypothetical protein [Amaricoccus sp.]